MNHVTKEIIIDISKETSFECIEAVQGDRLTRYVCVTLLNNAAPYPLDSATPVLRGCTPDGADIFNACQITGDGKLLVELTSRMLSSPGITSYEIALYGESMEVLTSFPFRLSVSPASFRPEAVTFSDEFTMIADIMKNVNNLRDAVDDAVRQASVSSAKALEAAVSENAAAAAADTAAANADAAAANADAAAEAEHAAVTAAGDAAKSAESAGASEADAKMSETTARRHLDDMREIADSFEGTLRPRGEILFEDLPPASDAEDGDLYTVTNPFTTSSDFSGGEGTDMPRRTSVYRDASGAWTALAGGGVSGIRGDRESEFRTGNVIISPSHIGLGNADNTSDLDKPVSVAQREALDAYYRQSSGYTDQKIADLINGAPSTLDTLGEIAQAFADNADVVTALEASVGSKASEAEFDSHVKDKSAHVTAAERNGWADPSPAFTQAASKENISSGERLSVMLGKIKKFFADLKTVAFSGSYTDLINKPAIPAAVRVKGSAESEYRTGDVSLTAANLGLGNVDNTADKDKNVASAYSAAISDYASKADRADSADHSTTADYAAAAENATRANAADSAGNCDTVDGKHASDFLSAGGGKINGNLRVGDCIELVSDNEGGNLVFLSSDGRYRYETDIASGNAIRLFTVDNSTGQTGALILLTQDGYCTGINTLHVNGLESNIWNVFQDGSPRHAIYSSSDSLILGCGSGGATVRARNNLNEYLRITAASFDTASSRKAKENIQDITEEEARKLLDVPVVTFDYTERFGGKKNQRGVIAEDVCGIIPSAVTMPENYDETASLPVDGIAAVPTVDYSKFVPYLIKMVQLQEKQLKGLEERYGNYNQ